MFLKESNKKASSIPSLAFCLVLFLVSCARKDVRVIDKIKLIKASGSKDTVYFERSNYWDHDKGIARTDSNRQIITFKPQGKDIWYVTLQNMGTVPLKRDTIRKATTVPAEFYLRSVTRDTNMHLHIEFSDWRKPHTDVVVYIRDIDSVYHEIIFAGN